MPSLSDAVQFYRCTLMQAHILEMPPTDPIVEAFFEWSRPTHHLPLSKVVGLEPDLYSARRMCELTREDVAEKTLGSEYELEMIELGVARATVGDALLICKFLGWPLGVLFRDTEVHWHRRTFLGIIHTHPEAL